MSYLEVLCLAGYVVIGLLMTSAFQEKLERFHEYKYDNKLPPHSYRLYYRYFWILWPIGVPIFLIGFRQQKVKRFQTHTGIETEF